MKSETKENLITAKLQLPQSWVKNTWILNALKVVIDAIIELEEKSNESRETNK